MKRAPHITAGREAAPRTELADTAVAKPHGNARLLLNRFRQNIGSWLTPLLLTAVILVSLKIFLAPTLFLPWYFNTEEFPFVQEILRFSEFDFHQQFFDIPGTPFMALGTLLWWPCYLMARIFDPAHTAGGIRAFNFDHLQQLYVLLRLTGAALFALSVLLTYLIAKRLANPITGYVAAAILAFHPILDGTVYHIRIEPMAVATVLLSGWLMLRALDRHSYRLSLLAGMVAGMCLGVRYPSAIASISFVLACALLRLQHFRAKRRLNIVFLALVSAIILTGGLIALLLRLDYIRRSSLTDQLLISFPGSNLAGAAATVQKAWLGAAALLILPLLTIPIPIARRGMNRLVNSQVPAVVMGCLLGAILGLPTILWQRNYFLGAIEMFIDRNKSGVFQTGNILDTVQLYLFGYVRDQRFYHSEQGVCLSIVHVFLLGAGLATLVWFGFRSRKKWLLYALPICGLIGLLAQHGKIQTARHIASWLPYFAIMMALPVGAFFEGFALRWRHFLVLIPAISGLAYLGYRTSELVVRPNIDLFLEKNFLMPRMDEWLDRKADKSLTSFHVCCETADAEVILSWMRMNGVSLPEKIRDAHFKRTIWFGEKQVLEAAGKGYIVISKNTYKGFYLDYYSHVDASKAVDPAVDPHFKLATEIKGPSNTWLIYEFDFGNPNLVRAIQEKAGTVL
jgi:hypothetical protein